MATVPALSKREAATALYIDFESLGNNIERPAILGVLAIDTAGDRFEQYLLDDRLSGAVVARKGVCRNATTEKAITAVVEQAERESRPVVTWSTHECAVVQASCSTALASRFSAVHRNALDTARAWKRKLYPTFPFTLKKFGGRHPLKEYMRIIGYAAPPHIRPAAPAKWLKHTLQQMSAKAGRYRTITQEAKRDWHKLLVYNEHDCRGMRKAVVRAAHELELWAAYQQTQFVVLQSGREIAIRAGYNTPALDRLLASVGERRWAFLTAYNPASARLDGAENQQRQQQMVDELVADGYTILPAEGRDPRGQWPAEESVLVAGIGRRDARAIGRQFGQLAILIGHAGFPARLVASGLPPDRFPHNETSGES